MRSSIKSLLCAVVALSATLGFASPASASDDDLEPRQPSRDSVVYRTAAIIDAPSARIWNLLVDLPGYDDWNPFVSGASGDVVPGGDVELDAKLFGHHLHMKHKILVVEPERRLCWKDSGWSTWFVYGQRCRTMERRSDGSVLFKQEVLIDGAMSSVTARMMGKALRKGIEDETSALKRTAEW